MLVSTHGLQNKTSSIDGIAKLPDPFVEKLIEYHLFDPEMCHMTAAKVDQNGAHVARSFKKIETTIASEEAVSISFNTQY